MKRLLLLREYCKWISICSLSAFLLGVSPAALAQVNVEAKLDTNVALIGDQLHLTVQVIHSANLKVTFPLIQDSIGPIEVIAQTPIDTLKVAQPPSVNLKKEYTLSCFDSGYYVIPPLRFYFSTIGSDFVDSAQTEPLVITFNTIPVDTTLAIKDIKGPMEVPFSWKEALPYILGILALGLAIYFAIYFWRRRKQPERFVPAKPKRPAHETALEELDKLAALKLWQQGQIKQYHSQLTDIVRMYIEQRFEINAMEYTTDEIMQSFRNNLLDQTLQLHLKRMLQLADLVKFAKVQPLPDENSRSLEFAYEFVRSTMKVNVEPEQNENSTTNNSSEELNTTTP